MNSRAKWSALTYLSMLKQSGVLPDAASHSERIVIYAILISLEKRRKSLRLRGRVQDGKPLTRRQTAAWVRALWSDVAMLLKPFERLGTFDRLSDDDLLLVRKSLLFELIDVVSDNEKRGRPAKNMDGLIGSSQDKILSLGHARTLKRDQEKRWINRLRGNAFRQFSNEEMMAWSHKQPQDIIASRRWDHRTWKESLAKYIRQALEDPAMLPYNPRAKTFESLVKRARSAHFEYPLPPLFKVE